MNSIAKTLVGGALLALSLNSFAAKPTSIVFDSNGSTEQGDAYANYLVKCSNGKKVPMTAWDNRKKWCVGEASTENCQKKQIKAAKKACKIS